MQPAKVIATAHATIKHESFEGQRLVIAQPFGTDDANDGPPLLVIDSFGARIGDKVILTSDGSYARTVTSHKATPARWSVAGIVD